MSHLSPSAPGPQAARGGLYGAPLDPRPGTERATDQRVLKKQGHWPQLSLALTTLAAASTTVYVGGVTGCSATWWEHPAAVFPGSQGPRRLGIGQQQRRHCYFGISENQEGSQ